MESMKVLHYVPSREEEQFIKFQSRYVNTCEKIQRSWNAMGYKGDPIMDLTSAMTGMAVYGPQGKR